MFPILFKFGPFTIYSYGLMLFIAVFTALNLLTKEAQRQGYDKDIILDLGIIIVLSGIVGARILYVLLNLDFYKDNLQEIFMLHHGGLAIWGGMFLAALSGFVFTKIKKLSFLETTDLIVPFFALAQSIGRVGCFFNGCCFGITSKFGIYFPVHNAVLIPTQLISSFLLLFLFLVLRKRQMKPHLSGEIFMSYILYYSTGRFFIEFIRADSPKLFLGLTIFQYFCVIFFLIALIVIISLKWKNKLLK